MQEGTGASMPPGLDPRGTRRELGESQQTRLTRRAFVRGTALGGAVALVAACAPAEGRPPGGAPASGGAAAAPGSGVTSGGAAPPAAASPRQVDYGIISPTALYWTAFVMQGKGLLEREGLKGEITITRTPAAGLQMLVADGGITIQGSGTDSAIRAVEQGSDFVFVGSAMDNPAYTLISQPSVTSLRDLRGKSVAVAGPRDGPTTFIRRLLTHEGIDPSSVDFISTGGTPERYAALKAGAVAATVLSQPNDFQAEAEGFRRLLRLADVIGVYQFVAWTVRRSWARENEDTLVRFLRANAAACRWLNDQANKEEAIAILSEAAKVEERYSRLTYELYLEELPGLVLPLDGSVNMPGLQAAIAVMGELGEFEGRPLPSPEKYVDQSYQQKALRG